VLDTPGTPTIATLVARLNELEPDREWTAADTLKNVVLKTHQPGTAEWELLVVGVPGDREVDMKRISGQLEPVEVEQAEPAELTKAGLTQGYLGPQGLADLKVRYLVDPLVVEGSAWVTGANEPDKHAADVVRGRDFVPDGEIGAVEIRDGDRCARDGGVLSIARGIEIGHVFQLGRKFTDAFGLDALGPDSKPVRITMGSYGIGVSRAVAVIAEQTIDGKGLCWPREVAPADVHIVATGKDDLVFAQAGRIAAELDGQGVRVLYDDRTGVSPGVKFKDAELLGVPTIVIVGKRLTDGVVEVKDRKTDEREDVPLETSVEHLATLARG